MKTVLSLGRGNSLSFRMDRQGLMGHSTGEGDKEVGQWWPMVVVEWAYPSPRLL